MVSGSGNVQFPWTVQINILERSQPSVCTGLCSVKHKHTLFLQSNTCKHMLLMLIYSYVYMFCGRRLSLKQTGAQVCLVVEKLSDR